ncbi:MAG: hypothetical protein NVSMB51_11490 [Solirubrobacteraceae bacterium]
MSDQRAAAFFDLDRTLVEGSSGIHFVRAAYEAGLLSRRRLAADLLANIRFRLRGSTDAEAEVVRERVGRMIEGVEVRSLQRLSHRVLAGVLPNIFPEMLALAHEHQDAGRPVFICTAASQEMADLMAHVLGFDGAVGSRSEVQGGRYTGRAAGPFSYGEGKATLLRDLADERGLDLSASFAYSDSCSDLPMLRAVGNPVVVNPDAELARVARVEGWPVMFVDRLRRRIRIAGAAAALGAAALGTGALAGRRLRLR